MRGLLIFLACLAAFIIGVSFYLQPNDFTGCGTTPKTGCSTADAIVVVSGGDTQARVDAGVKLFNNGWARMLVFSGAAQDKSGPSNAEAMRRQAIAAGVPESAILVDEDAVNTQQNAENTQSILTEHNLKRVILVTSGYHQRRASLEFQKEAQAGVKVLNWPVAKDKDWSALWWMTPRGWWLAGGELVKIIAFYTGAGR
ncbi:YdcF family protein [Candidatus Saccharibacteria bacterium TM7i]|nr:YdcF family protein [Candidatus Saccharibacteria bacterium TM7i]